MGHQHLPGESGCPGGLRRAGRVQVLGRSCLWEQLGGGEMLVAET